MDLKKYIADIQDFPQKGILFRDMTPLLQDGKAFRYAIDQLATFAKNQGAELIVGPEARGFLELPWPVNLTLDLLLFVSQTNYLAKPLVMNML